MAEIPRWQTPISRWQLDGNANDLYGLYNGTASNMTYSTDAKEKGLSGSFSSSPVGYVNLSGLSLSSYDNFTMSIWVKCTSSGEMYLTHERVGSPDYRTAIVIRGGSAIRILTYVNSTFYLVDSAVTIDRYVWNHIVVTFSGSATASVSVYLNGKIYNTGSLTRYPSYQAPTFYLGAYAPSTTSKLVGYMDDVRFYDIALTADEVMNLYKSYATPIWQQPLHHWKLDGNANDSAGSRNGTASSITYSNSQKILSTSAASFTGGDSSYVSIDGLDPVSYTNFTISLWIKATPYASCQFAWAQSDSLSAYRGNIYSDNEAYLRYGVNNSGGSVINLPTNKSVLDSKWHHYTVTDANGTVNVYVDGVYNVNGSYTRYGNYPAEYCTIGGLRLMGYTNGYPGYNTKGLLQDVRFYDVALTAAEIKALYNSYFTEKAISFISSMV